MQPTTMPVRHYRLTPAIIAGALLFSVAFFCLTAMAASPLQRLTSSDNGIAVAIDTTSSIPVIEYSLHDHQIANSDLQPQIQVFADGTVKIHHPVYMKQAGDFTMRLTPAETASLIRLFIDNAMTEIDPSVIAAKKQAAEAAKRKRGLLENISDSITTHITINLAEYKNLKTGQLIPDYSKSLHFTNITHDLKRYPDIPEITSINRGISALRALQSHVKLKQMRTP